MNQNLIVEMPPPQMNTGPSYPGTVQHLPNHPLKQSTAWQRSLETVRGGRVGGVQNKQHSLSSTEA